jgi:Zn-dependent protease with chaperone function
MLRLGTLLSFAAIAFGQSPRQSAYVSIEIAAKGELNATLTVPAARVPAELPATFAHAVGCDMRGLMRASYPSQIRVQCPLTRTSALTFHAAFRLSELAPQLLQAGVDQLNLSMSTPHFRSIRLDPPFPEYVEGSNGYHRAQYSLDPLPPRIVIDGGFEMKQVRTLVAAAIGLILAPFLLLLLRPSDPLHLRVQMEAIFVLGWIGWIWALAHEEAGGLLSYALGQWVIGPMLALLVPPLLAVWIGSRLAAKVHARVTSNALGADYYRRIRFWSGAAGACFVSTLLGLLLFTFTAHWSLLFGAVLTIACLLCIRRIGRGRSRPLPEGDLRRRTFESAARAGVNLRGVSILTAPTPRPPTALATRWGVVLLNEGLLASLSRREVDAVVCHELSHIGPVNRFAMGGIYILLVVSILGVQWFPHVTDVVPIALLALYFTIKAWRRAGEWKADLDSVRWSGDPEAMITGLARVSRAHGMPLEWGAPISWMMSHPPTMDRIRAIAQAGGINASRVGELMEESQKGPADSYADVATVIPRAATVSNSAVPQGAAVPEDAAFSPAVRKRLQTRLAGFALAAPLVLGLPTVWLLQRMGFPWWTVFFAGIVFPALATYVGSDWIVGSVRDTARGRSLARHGQGIFAGFSPSTEPRLFERSYHYDLGMVRFANGGLEFAGDRARFILDRRLVQRVWLGAGPRHWVSRKVVYIECQPSADTGLIVFSLQSLEARFWPWTTTTAMRLYRAVQHWHRDASPASTAPPLPCQVPQVEGDPVGFISFRAAVRTVGLYSGIAFFLASLELWSDGSRGVWDPSDVLCSVAVCGVLSFIMVCPRLNWSRLKPMTGSQSRLPAGS